MASLVSLIQATRVSSVLNKDNRSYGKKHLFDGNEETCWNSEQGSPQSIVVQFSKPVRLDEIRIMFQGGFAGKHAQVWVASAAEETLRHHSNFYPDDNNTLQISSFL
ncbi:Nuclear receptor 2C2-associated protein [Dimargaris cristalligena]|nr:Nuclear receptor 2C2-associated protein [Dimargaris cristalligena]